MSAEPIRIMLVDDHAVVRAGFRRLLDQEPGIRVVAEADSGERAYLLYLEHTPDVMVLDLSMPGVSGFETIRRITERQADAKILVFSMHEDASLAVRAIQLGARGYVTKSNAPEVLATAVGAVAAGKLFLSDGKDAWFYVAGERQVRRTAVKKLDDLRSPLAFLLGKTKLEKELQGLSVAPDVAPLAPGNVVLRGVPKSLADRVNQVLVEITPERWIGRLIIEEVDGSVTEYRFSNQKENVAMPDRQFQFAVPDGVEVIDGELGQ